MTGRRELISMWESFIHEDPVVKNQNELSRLLMRMG